MRRTNLDQPLAVKMYRAWKAEGRAAPGQGRRRPRRGAHAHGLSTHPWTLPRIATVIEPASAYQLTLDLADEEDRQAWDFGDCTVRIDLHDGPGKHLSFPRGPLRPAFELFSLIPAEAPSSPEGRLLWEIGKTVHHYVDRLFETGILCPFKEQEDDAPERTS